MTKSRVQAARSSVTRQRPADQDPGVLYVNFADLQIGTMDVSREPVDLVAVRFHSFDADYLVGDFVIYANELYRATANSTAGPFVPANWTAYGPSTGTIDWSQIVNEPTTFPPVLPILQSDVVGLQDELAEKIEDAPSDGDQYARQDAAWVVVTGGGGSTDWADITGKPATFPPTLPIAQSGVTGLVPDLAGKAPTVHTHAQADITNLTTDLAGKISDTGDTMTGPLSLPATGTVAATVLNFGTAGTGIYGTTNQIVLTQSGVAKLTIGNATTSANALRVGGAVSAPGYSFTSDTDAGLYLSAAGDMRMAMGGADVVKWLDDKSTTFSGKVVTVASAAGGAGFNVPTGAAPTSPVEGDIWLASNVLSYRANASTTTDLMNLVSTQTATGPKTFSGKTTFRTGNATFASVNFPTGGVAPTTPSDGDVWSTTANGLYMRIGGVTKSLVIHVGTTAPASPITNDLWLDIN